MTDPVPSHLASTVAMLAAAFPEGVQEQERLPLLRALYDHMSDRNLAEAMAIVTKSSPDQVLNEVYAASQLDLTDPRVESVTHRLRSHGFERWSVEDEAT